MTTRSGLLLRTPVCPPTPEADRTFQNNAGQISSPISVSQAVKNARQCFEDHRLCQIQPMKTRLNAVDFMETTDDEKQTSVSINIPLQRIKQDGQSPCDHCGKDLATEEEAIGCDSDNCSRWFHPSCLNDKSYLKETNWYCHLCPNIDAEPTHRQDEIEDIQIPDPEPSVSSIDKASWGILKGSDIATSVQKAYDKIVKWRRNLFKVPTGKIGQEFIEEVAKTISLYTAGSHFESVALTMAMIMFPLLLQKPSQGSKSKDHVEYLKKRLLLWRAGELDNLIKEGSVIQERMKSPKIDSKHHEKVFCRLMLQGKISAALRWIGSQQSTLLDATDEVLDVLKEKHPDSQPARQGSLLSGPVAKVEEVIFEAIDGDLIHRVAKTISGAAGPSGADAELWQRILCSKQFKKKPEMLCEGIAELAKKLCRHAVNPDHLQSFTAGRLIPLAKKPSGVRPIGIGEVLRRIVGKAVTSILKHDLVASTAPVQVCAGLPGGVEAAIHAMRRIYEDPETEAILLVDAENAFNSLNRNVALHNIQRTCPEFSTYIINTYRKPAKLLIANSDELIFSEEGTTQGDTGAMGMYACSLMPLIDFMKHSNVTTAEKILSPQILSYQIRSHQTLSPLLLNKCTMQMMQPVQVN